MRYKRMGHNRTYRVNVPMLSGGVNVAEHPTHIDDSELAAMQNWRWKSGALQKRQAVRAVGTQPFTALGPTSPLAPSSTADSVLSHPLEVGGELCTVVHSGMLYDDVTAYESVQVVSLDGEVKATYRVSERYVQDAAFAPCDPVKYGSPFLMFRGRTVFKPDDNAGKMTAVPEEELYAPLVMVNGKSTVNASAEDTSGVANGVMYEGFNLLTRRFRARFTTQGGSGAECFKMPVPLANGTAVSLELITPQGTVQLSGRVGETVEGDAYKVHAHADGRIDVYPCPPKSLVADNLTVTATAISTSVAQMEQGAALACWFGGTQNKLGGTRLFLAGFAGDKAKLMWSDVNNPLYFPENNYMFVGDLSQRITALEKQGDMLVIFKERETYYTTYVQGDIDAQSVVEGTNVDVTASQAYFPLTQLSPYIGCDAPHSIASCRDRLVWMCADGRVYTLVAGSPYSERNVREIGQKVHPLMRAHDKAQLENASAMDHDGCYTVLIGATAYSFDYGDGGFVSLTSYSSSDKAARAIAWYVHRFEGFYSGETLRLVSDGAYRAILISTQNIGRYFPCVRVLYRFEEADKDSHAAVSLSSSLDSLGTVITDHPITARLTTKTFTFGDISSFKRIDALFLYAEGGQLTLTVSADGKESGGPRRVTAGVGGGQLVLPGVKRCRTCSVTLTTEDAARLLGLQLRYTPFGTVR